MITRGFFVALGLFVLLLAVSAPAKASSSDDCEGMLANYSWDNDHLSMAADALDAAAAQLQADYNGHVSQAQLDQDVNAYNGAYGMYQGWSAAVGADLDAMHEAHCM